MNISTIKTSYKGIANNRNHFANFYARYRTFYSFLTNFVIYVYQHDDAHYAFYVRVRMTHVCVQYICACICIRIYVYVCMHVGMGTCCTL